MRILVLGGTVFLGRHLVAAAIENGHDVTLFNRGNHPNTFPNVETIVGDRKTDIDRLQGSWDVVVDTSGYFPRDVTASASHLSSMADRYVFVSSLSVYADAFTTPGIDESGALLTADPSDTEVTGENYGGLKALCEQAAEETMPGRALTVRPGLIVGPYDPSDRFNYWAARFLRGGDVLAPAPPEDPVQFIDVRDLAEWILRMVEQRATGTFNANGPDRELSMGQTLETGLASGGAGGELVWADGVWLVEQGVKPWTEMPLWVPNAVGFSRFDSSKAIAAGLTFRPVRDTFVDTQTWLRERPDDHEWRAGITSAREQELLHIWRAKTA